MNRTNVLIYQHINVDDAFLRRFKWWGRGWLVATFFIAIFVDYVVFHSQPSYLRDWHFPVILVLSCMMVAVYGYSIINRKGTWPPPLTRTLPTLLILYGIVLLLSMISQPFLWCLYIVFGLTLSLTGGRLLLLLITVLFVTFCLLGGLLTWPLDVNNVATMLGLGVSFYGTAAIAMVMQTLLGERYKRNRLLQELAEANTELATAHQKLAETATQEQELAVLRERTRLAREMHDTLGHALVLVTVKLEVAQRLRERDPERCGRELEATQVIVRESMNNLRSSIANLRSPVLEHEPVSRALSRFAREMGERSGTQVICELGSDIECLPEQVEEILWKVGQEALVNVEKHAHATSLLLHLNRHDARVLMRIEDNGVGIPECLYRSTSCESPMGHYGLDGMIERVENVGGSIQIKRGQEHGTIVEVVLPLIEAVVT